MASDKLRGGGPRIFSAVIVLVLSITILVLGMNVMAASSGQHQPYFEQSEAWCSERGGELHNVRAFGHGGLHCELPNGTSVHMWEVVDVEESVSS